MKIEAPWAYIAGFVHLNHINTTKVSLLGHEKDTEKPGLVIVMRKRLNYCLA